MHKRDIVYHQSVHFDLMFDWLNWNAESNLPLPPPPNRNYMADSQAQIQPLVEKVQAEATKLQKQVKPFIANIEDQIRPITENFKTKVLPLTGNVQTQVKPLVDMVEKFFVQILDETKALLPPQ